MSERHGDEGSTQGKLNYDPYKGSHYEAGYSNGLRLLILGHSFHSDTWDRTAPTDVVLQHHIPDKLGFFNDVEHMVAGAPAKNEQERRAFWNKVAFTNIVQEPMDTPTTQPSREQWRQGWACFPEAISQTQPDLIFCFTRKGWNIQATFPTPFTASVNLDHILNESGPESYRKDCPYLYNCSSIRPGYRVMAAGFTHPRIARIGGMLDAWHRWALRLIAAAPIELARDRAQS